MMNRELIFFAQDLDRLSPKSVSDVIALILDVHKQLRSVDDYIDDTSIHPSDDGFLFHIRINIYDNKRDKVFQDSRTISVVPKLGRENS